MIWQTYHQPILVLSKNYNPKSMKNHPKSLLVKSPFGFLLKFNPHGKTPGINGRAFLVPPAKATTKAPSSEAMTSFLRGGRRNASLHFSCFQGMWFYTFALLFILYLNSIYCKLFIYTFWFLFCGFILCISIYTGWWLTYPSEKWWSSSVEGCLFPI